MAYFLCRLSGPRTSFPMNPAGAGFSLSAAPRPQVGLRQAKAQDLVS
jgi:hypothetical protein